MGAHQKQHYSLNSFPAIGFNLREFSGTAHFVS